MNESTCYRCGEEVEPSFDICWNCGTVLRSSDRVDEAVEVLPATTIEAGKPRRQFRLRHIFIWTTIVAVLCAIFTSAIAPYAATWLLIVGGWLLAGLALMLLLIVLVHLSMSRWSPFTLWRFLDLANDERSDDGGVPFDVWHLREQQREGNRSSDAPP